MKCGFEFFIRVAESHQIASDLVSEFALVLPYDRYEIIVFSWRLALDKGYIGCVAAGLFPI